MESLLHVSVEDRDNANKADLDLHSLLRIEVPTHANLPTRMIHPKCGGQCVPAPFLSGSPVTPTKYHIEKLPPD